MDARLEKLKHDLESAAEGMSSQQLSWHPEGKWCAAEILEHLYQSYSGTIMGFERVLKAGKPLATRPSLTQRGRNFLVLGLNYMPQGRKAPAAALPKGLPIDKVRSEFGQKMAAMDAVIAQCEERHGSRIPLLDHPILGPLNAAQWRKLHLLHGRHHRKQLLRLRQSTPQSN
jgi:hypothetical protein